MSSRTRSIWLLGGFVAVAVAALVAYAAALSALKGRIAAGLGPNSETREIRMGLWGLALDGLRIRAPSGWPAEDALRAEQLTIVPSLLTLVSGDSLRIRSIAIEAPYLSVLRDKQAGLEVLPGMFGRSAPEAPAGEAAKDVGGAIMDLFDREPERK